MLWQNEKNNFPAQKSEVPSVCIYMIPFIDNGEILIRLNFLNQSKYQGTTVLQLLFDTVLYHSEGNK